MACPKCGVGTSLFRCDYCGDVRCSSTASSPKPGCGSSRGPNGPGKGAGGGMPCHVCKNGHYEKL